MVIFEYIDIDKAILKNIDIDKEILQNIDKIIMQNGKIRSFLPVFSLFWCFSPDLLMKYSFLQTFIQVKID